jgi:hypothetical protein
MSPAIGQMGLFQTVSIDTLDIAIEKDKAQNGMLVRQAPAAGPARPSAGQALDAHPA